MRLKSTRLSIGDKKIAENLSSRAELLRGVKIPGLLESIKLLALKFESLATRDLIIREGEDEPREEIRIDDFSQKQQERVHIQTVVVTKILGRLRDRFKSELAVIVDSLEAMEAAHANGLAEDEPAKLAFIQRARDALKQEQQVYLVVQEETNEYNRFYALNESKHLKASTVLGWYQDFNRMNSKGFSEDLRGHRSSDNWLEANGLVEILRLFMRVEVNGICVDKVNKFLNDTATAHLAKTGEDIGQVSRAQAHRYMKLAGASWSAAQWRATAPTSRRMRSSRGACAI
jgi:hypothetical protein